MQLSRREAVLALAALGTTVGGAHGGIQDSERNPTSDDDDRIVAIYAAVAGVVYPTELSGIEDFVETFVRGRVDRPEHGAGMRTAAEEVDRLAREWYGAPVDELSLADRDRLLHEIGADSAEEHPDGTTAERVRYYVVNDLLLGLFRSPTGGELVGLENPPGYAGGTESYTQGAERGR